MGQNGDQHLPGAGSVLKLRRLMSEGFRIEDCCELKVFEDYQDDDILADIPLVSVADGLKHLPAISVLPGDMIQWKMGRMLPAKILNPSTESSPNGLDRGQALRAFSATDQTFLGVGEVLMDYDNPFPETSGEPMYLVSRLVHLNYNDPDTR